MIVPTICRDIMSDQRATQPPKPQRLLACVLCRQRKVKCDRQFPCANCTRLQATCVPATVATRRRRRPPTEKDLLKPLRKCEDLLRQNNIPVDALPHGPGEGDTSANKDGRNGPGSENKQADGPSSSASATPQAVHEPKCVPSLLG
jgi:hypothetical protein